MEMKNMADTYFKYVGRGTEKLAPHGELVKPGVPFKSPEQYVQTYENCAVYEKCDKDGEKVTGTDYPPVDRKARRGKPPVIPKDGDDE